MAVLFEGTGISLTNPRVRPSRNPNAHSYLIYLDYAATTPLDPLVLRAMMPFLTDDFGNASSVHALGRRARFAVEESREKVASLIGAEPGEVLFTSGGTEANNTVLKGIVCHERGLLTSGAEHESILRPAEALCRSGCQVQIVAPGPTGALSAEEVQANLTGGASLVSLMHGNNEIGTLTDIEAIVEVAHRRGAIMHCDAVQTAGFGLLRADEVAVDLMTISGHKFYGPKGVGVLFMRGGTDLEPLLAGGAQERRRRGGTENVPAIVGFAEAMKLALIEAVDIRENVSRLRDRLLDGLKSMLREEFVLNTPVGRAPVAPHILNVSFPPSNGAPLDGEMLLLNLDLEGIRVSAGSACTSGALEPSHVLRAIGVDRKTAGATIRFSLGRHTSEEDVDATVEAVARVLARMRQTAAIV